MFGLLLKWVEILMINYRQSILDVELDSRVVPYEG
jgi:hypothetical protein